MSTIEIDHLPEILRSQSDDMIEGLTTLSDILSGEAEVADD